MNEFPADWPVLVRIVWDAGISPPVTKGLRQDERDWFRSLASPGSGARKVLGVQYADFRLSAGDGFVVDNPGLPQIAVKIADRDPVAAPAQTRVVSVDVIYVLLDLAPRWADRAPPLIPADPDPVAAPVRVRLVWDAGIRSPVTRELGQAGQGLFGALVNPDPGARGLPDVQYADFRPSAGDGFVVDNPELPEIAVGRTADVINVLLVPADPGPFPPFRPYGDMGPFPVREPGFDFGL
jgi:hypothetical protein